MVSKPVPSPQPLSRADEDRLRRQVGAATLGRGRSYAHSGAVIEWAWIEADLLEGLVAGRGSQPYETSVELHRRAGRLTRMDGDCSCPVGMDCKHAVALLLAAVDGRAPAGRGEPTAHTLALVPPAPARPVPPPAPPRWDDPLQGLLGTGRPASPPPTMAVQFELIAEPVPAIRLRPVIRGARGGWVRQGVSWMSLTQAYGPGPGIAGDRLAKLQELVTLSRLGQPYLFSYQQRDEPMWLHGFASRRVWDLFAELRDLGVPLLTAGRPARPVRLAAGPGHVTVDASRSARRLTLTGSVLAGSEVVPRSSSLLVGDPAHGVAWWLGDVLHLAGFDEPVTPAMRRLLDAEPITVPHQAERRFWRDVYPDLSHSLAVTCHDGSVELPAPAPPTLTAVVTHLDPGHIEVTWEAAGVERAVLEQAVDALGAAPELVEADDLGERPGPASFAGMAVVRLVNDVLPVLGALDGVEVEQRGAVAEYREAEEVPVVHVGGAGSADGDWFDLAVTVTVEGEEVPFGELFVALATDQPHLLLPSGTWFSLDRPELRRLAELIAEARALGDPATDQLRLSRFHVSLWDELKRLGVLDTQATAWEQSVHALLGAAERTDLPAPAGLHAELRPYQLTGFNWLAHLHALGLGGILADDMGLGKTLQAVALILHTKATGAAKTPWLVVAPTSVVSGWVAECRRFAPDLRVVGVTETSKRRGTPLSDLAGGADLVVTSYALFRIEPDAYDGITWSGLFLDEAQFAKNRHSQAYARAKLLAAPCKVAITGTPMENNLMELWSLLSITAPGLLPDPERFAEHYQVPIEKGRDVERLDLLRRRIRPLLLRRTKAEVAAELPARQEQVLELDLHPRHRKAYQVHLQRERQKVLGLIGDLDRNRFAILQSLTLLRQACLDTSLVNRSAPTRRPAVPSVKLDTLGDMISDIVADGHRVLVFSQFTRFLELARQRMQVAGIQHCYLDGRTRRRAAVIDEFRTGQAPVFLISLKAGGFGLNLTEADYCFLLDPWWNPATEAQAVDRIHRIGQTRNVMVYRMVASDTVEEKVMALKAKKAALFADVIDGGGFDGGALTADDLASLVS